MSGQPFQSGRITYIVDGLRTPILKARGEPGPFSAADLGVLAGRSLLLKYDFDPKVIDEVVVGCVMPSMDEANIARLIALRCGCGDQMPAWTVQRNCASGLQAIDSGANNISTGRYELSLVGGTEAMSHAPLLYSQAMVRWIGTLAKAKKNSEKFKAMAQFRPNLLKPVIALLRGLTDPLIGMNMGQTVERLCYQFSITREQMDEFSVRSHQRLAHAKENQLIPEIVPIYTNQGELYDFDTGLRADTTLEKLTNLKPVFDKKFGLITAGNSSQVSDGSAMLLLASEAAIHRYQLPVLGRVVDIQWSALDPRQMGLGPAHAVPPLLMRHGLTMDDIDYWEINEAFAGQVLACLLAWQDREYCQTHLGLSDAFGTLDQAKLNVDGGAVAIGHPVGTSGARLVLHILKVLERNQAKYGVATMCIGGGQGGAILVERVS